MQGLTSWLCCCVALLQLLGPVCCQLVGGAWWVGVVSLNAAVHCPACKVLCVLLCLWAAGAKLLPGCEGGNLSGPSWQRRNRAAAGVAFDLEGLGSMRERGTQRRSGINSSSCPDLTGLRFACLLPPGHLLTKTAEQLQRQQEFEAALQASKAAAAAAAAAARAQQHAPTVLQLPGKRVPRCGDEGRYRPGSGNSCSSYQRSPAGGPTSPFRWAADDHARPSLGFSLTGLKAGHSDRGGILAEPSSMPDPLSCSFKAPSRSVEQIWKDGRRATTEAVLDAAHLQLHEGPFGALLLEPSLVLQARAVQQQASSDLDATAAAAWARPNSARSRRGPATSRPCSPAAADGSRRGTRFNTVGVVANAHVAEGAAQSGGPLAVLGSVIGASAAGCGNVIAVGDGTGLVGRQRFAAVAPESPFMRPSMWATSPAAAASCKGSIAMGDAGTIFWHAATAAACHFCLAEPSTTVLMEQMQVLLGGWALLALG
ncbi:hypothetical protein COO60DRAFT_856953 [Scenedesmus sp. NREL 46B-D3]|nr:hypothetical protein COO60DRAFT_856953 [Scenedesmus sp. NREL 46B-D3]